MQTHTIFAVTQANGGNLDLVRAMGEAARDTLNGLIAVVTYGDESAKVANTFSPTQVYGHSGGQLWVKLGGTGMAAKLRRRRRRQRRAVGAAGDADRRRRHVAEARER
jgi:hypothetical protein